MMPIATTEPAAKMVQARRGEVGDATAAAGAGTPAAGVGTGVRAASIAASSAETSSSADWYRSAGFLASDFMITASTCGATSSRVAVIERGRSVMVRMMMARAVGPVNGGSPASISYSTLPVA